MSGGKQTPRQAMIGLMYLVLLAMLAMNASKDLLNAFVMLEHGIDKTVTGFSQANSSYYSTIEKAAASSSSYNKVLAQANEVKSKAQAVVDLIAVQKLTLVSKGVLTLFLESQDKASLPEIIEGLARCTGRMEEVKVILDEGNESDHLKAFQDSLGMSEIQAKAIIESKVADFYDSHGIPYAKDDQDFGAQFFLVNNDGNNGKELADSITVFKEVVANLLNNDKDISNDYLVTKYNKLFNTADLPDPHDPGVTTSWASKISEHLPLASVTANLSLWQNYIRNAEADVVSSIASKMDGEGMVVDKAQGLVQFENGYVLKGDTVKGQIFLAAYNSKSDPNIYLGVPDTNLFNKNGGQIKFAPGVKPKLPIIGKSTKLAVSNGKGVFSALANEVGTKTLTGVVEVISAKGTFYYLYNSEYMVAEPTATIAATAMNVFYVGVDNPVSISAPGASLEEIEIKGNGVSFKKGKKPGEYIARATKPNPKGTEISVMKVGGAKLGGMKFRVKRLPDPVATILKKKEGLMSKGKLKAATFIKAEMENFDFDVKVAVKEFKMTISIGGDLKEFKAKGNKLTGPMRSMLGKVKRGNRIYFEDIKVKLPDGSTRKVPSIILKVQ
ncbi:MAG: gliding motility-associated protein GldM [Glaciecola sp.]|jgi:gliding motility-associated protein GldM